MPSVCTFSRNSVKKYINHIYDDVMSVVAINNCADLTITTEKLKELFASLDPEKVDELGDEDCLRLPESEVDNIKSSYDSPMQRKEAYLDLYVHQHPYPSWANITYTLRWLGLRQQAVFVENTYVKGTQDTSSSVVSTIRNHTDVMYSVVHKLLSAFYVATFQCDTVLVMTTS